MPKTATAPVGEEAPPTTFQQAAEQKSLHPSSANSAFASRKSAVLNPSVNQS